MDLKPETKAEIILWDWLRNYGKVYMNRKNLLCCPIFRVEGNTREIPDMLLLTNLYGRDEAIVIEIKDGDIGSNIRSGIKIFDKYLINYYLGKTKYFIEDKEVIINRFIMATQYSPEGHLFGYGDFIQKNGCAVKNDWINKTVPKLEFVRTKEFGRYLLQDYSKWRKNNKIKECFGLGWLISSIVSDFSEEELKIQSGMKGRPIIQGITYNEKLKRWGQSLAKP